MNAFSSPAKQVVSLPRPEVVNFIGASTTGLQAQLFRKGIAVYSTPAYFPLTSANPAFVRLKISSGASPQWVVFSDRCNNPTYVNPDGQTVFKKLGFMDLFYVVGRSNGYLKIVKYNPSIINKGRIKEAKESENFGWVEEATMLMWPKAFVSFDDNEPVKAISMINDKSILETPQHFVFDSIKVFDAPSVQATGMCKIKMNDLVYAYKFTDDGNFVLIGKKEQILPDSSAKTNMLGWVPAQLIQPWGKRLYLTAVADEDMPADVLESKVNASFLNSNTPVAQNNSRNNDNAVKSASAVISDSAGKNFGSDQTKVVNSRMWHYTPVFNASPVLSKSFPVYSYSTGEGHTRMHSVGVPINIFNLPNTTVVNAKGTMLAYPDYRELHNNIHKINLVFVADGGSSMKRYFPILINFFQGIKDNLDSNMRLADHISYGAVVYRNRENCATAKSNIESTLISSNANDIVEFLYNQVAETNNCAGSIEAQPLFQGLQKALALFSDNMYQNNIIVLIGATGNNYYDASSPSKEELVNNLSKKNARIFAFQPYSQYSVLFNNFVLDLKDLLEKSAINLTEQQKFWTVRTEDLALTPQFNSSFKDTTAYYLDFPANSMVPGGILFPTKGSTGSYKEFENYITKTLDKIHAHHSKLLGALNIAFGKAGIKSENINPYLGTVLSNVDTSNNVHWVSNLSYNGYRYFAERSISSSAIDSVGVLQYCLILSADELQALQSNLSKLAINSTEPADVLRRKLHANFSHAIAMSDKYAQQSISRLRLSDGFEAITGIPTQNGLLGRYTIEDILSSSKMDNDNLGQLLQYFRTVNNNLKLRVTLGDAFFSVGQPYYMILGDVFSGDLLNRKIETLSSYR